MTVFQPSTFRLVEVSNLSHQIRLIGSASTIRPHFQALVIGATLPVTSSLTRPNYDRWAALVHFPSLGLVGQRFYIFFTGPLIVGQRFNSSFTRPSWGALLHLFHRALLGQRFYIFLIRSPGLAGQRFYDIIHPHYYIGLKIRSTVA